MDATEWTAVFTALGAGAAATYVELTRRLWREVAREREANLMLMLMVEYDALRDSISTIRRWYIANAIEGVNAVERFAEEWESSRTEEAEILDGHRFRVSRFFVKTRKLVRANYLPEKLAADALGGHAIEGVFLEMVDPLDAAIGGHNYGSADRDFYTALLSKYPRPKGKGSTE